MKRCETNEHKKMQCARVDMRETENNILNMDTQPPRTKSSLRLWGGPSGGAV